MSHEFGNIHTWTKDKLDTVRKYLDAYLKVMKNHNFRLTYIDAFAGTGYVNKKFKMPTAAAGLFSVLEEDSSIKDFIDGSARLALQTDPTFDEYLFLEKHRKRCKELELLKDEFPKCSIDVMPGDANKNVNRLCERDWLGTYSRGVLFMDPYGCQVSWETIKAVADTKAIDMWLLFPIGPVMRLLNKDGKIQQARRDRLDVMFGDQTWYDAFYEEQTIDRDLFGETRTVLQKTATFSSIAEFFTKKLKTVFVDAALNPMLLKNSKGTPMFMLTCAVGNPNGAEIAMRIAQHILGRGQELHDGR